MRSQAIIQLVLVGISLVVIFTIIRPMFDDIRADQDEATRFRTALDTVGQFNARLAELRNRADSFSSADMRALETYVPSSIDTLAVSRDIQQIAQQNQIIIQSITFTELGTEQDTEGANADESYTDPVTGLEVSGEGAQAPLAEEVANQLQTRQFTLSGLGSYERVTSMLADFERNEYPLRLVGLEFASDNESDIYQVTAVLETYALPLR